MNKNSDGFCFFFLFKNEKELCQIILIITCKIDKGGMKLKTFERSRDHRKLKTNGVLCSKLSSFMLKYSHLPHSSW